MKVVEPVKACERVFGIEKLFRIAALAIGHLSGRFTTAAGRPVVLQQLLTDHFLWPIHSLTLFDIVQSSEKSADINFAVLFLQS
jgi:hypothetical protein